MIETMLLRGVIVRWDGPAPQPGLAATSAIIANPMPAIQNAMTYDSFHALPNAVAPVPALVAGQAIPHDWLIYAPGLTTTTPLAGNDVLTGPIDGCPVLTYTPVQAALPAGYTGSPFAEQTPLAGGNPVVGVVNAAHVGTAHGFGGINTATRQNMRDALDRNARGFSAADENDAYLQSAVLTSDLLAVPAHVSTFCLTSLVTAGGAFFAIFFLRLQTALGTPKKWIVLNNKAAARKDGFALRNMLIPQNPF